MTAFTSVILSCTDCPFNNQDCVYCKTCDIPFLNNYFRIFAAFEKKGGVIQ